MFFDNPNQLTNEQIREKLTGLGYPSSLIESIIEVFWFYDPYQSFIAEPERFRLLLRFLEEKKPKIFNRFDFYYYFFEKAVPGYSSLRSHLEQLGLYFEQIQKNQIPEKEFIKVLENIGSPTQLTIDFLKGINLLTEKEVDGVKMSIWTQHTLTEFLAADNILSQEDSIEEFKKLAIETVVEKQMLKPSWTGTLRFLIEHDTDYFSLWCVEFFTENPDALVDQVTEMLVYASSKNATERVKKDIFKLVYGHYQEKKFWLPLWAYLHLYKFIGEEEYKQLKESADDPEYVRRGNIAAILNGMLTNNHESLTLEDREEWKKKLISYANEENENKVVNRHALSALENYKGDVTIIAEVGKNLLSGDQLVREAYVAMCRAIDPNSSDAISVFIDAIVSDTAHIYARNGLYFVDTQEGILLFLRNVAYNSRFIYKFLDDEPIFNSKERKADSELTLHIRENKNAEILTLLKKFIITAITCEHNYNAKDSFFLEQIALIIQEEEPGYLNEFIQALKDMEAGQRQTAFINGLEGILSVLLKPENLKEIDDIFKNELDRGYTSAQAVRMAPDTGNPQGKEVLKKGIELGITVDPNAPPKGKSYQEEQEDRIYEQFQEYLGDREKGTYYPDVYKFFLKNKEILKKRATQADLDYLKQLTANILAPVDPSKFVIRFVDEKTKSGAFRSTAYIQYLTEVFEVINEFDPSTLKKPENRKKVIDFIPFVYHSGFESLYKILGSLTDEELEPVNAAYTDPEKDLRYYSAQTYMFLSKTVPGLKTTKDVLLFLLKDPLIAGHVKIYILENIKEQLSKKDTEVEKLLREIWKPEKREQISDLANELLITVFQAEDALDWRFEHLKLSATAFRTPEGTHSPNDLEIELMSKRFARPLIELNDEKFLDRFIALLEFSLTLVDKPDHREYMNYLWSIVIEFVARDNFLLSFDALATLKTWAEEHLTTPEVNWLLKRISELTAYNNKVISVIESKVALDFLQGKITKWTYDLLREEMKKAGSIQDIIFFFSHASAGVGAAQGERNFVLKFNEKLKKLGYSTFFDEDYSSPSIKEKLNKYLPKSRFMIAICSERYRKRVCEDGAKEVSMELWHFGGREDATKLQQIFTVTYKISREKWKVIGIPELQGGKMQIAALHDADGEVEKAVQALLAWVKSIDPKSI